jgi:uncharacterized protein (UPF0305 family)
MPELENMIFFNGVLIKKNCIQKLDHEKLSACFESCKGVMMVDVETKEPCKFIDIRSFFNYMGAFFIAFFRTFNVSLHNTKIDKTGLLLIENLDLKRLKITDDTTIREIC